MKIFQKNFKKVLTKRFGCDIITELMNADCVKHSLVGVNDGEGPPVPIPNTVVKLIRAEDT